MANILIIDDDETMRYSLSRMVKRMGHTATCASTLGEGFEKTSSGVFDVVFLDVQLPDGSGLDALPRIQEAPSSPEVIIITGYGSPDGAELAIKSGVWDYIEKGCSVKDMTLPLVRALEYRNEKERSSGGKDVRALIRDDIVGNSQKLRACLDLVARAARSDVSVIITGETGTGKELFAQAIHRNNLRAKKNFVVVDCAALPETLVESMLFGHEKGSFTGADRAREGLILQADGGTLFLDEIGELPMSIQRAFLRVLQEHRFRPLGSKREVESDFRLVVATNRDLDQMVQNGQFRQDLLFRLRSLTIELPPLREWPEDIKDLARYHTDRICGRYGLAAKGFSPEFLATLEAYNWPGNVRELVNTVERAVAAARLEPSLFRKHLPIEIRVQLARAAVNHESHAEETGVKTPLRKLPKLHDFRESVYAEAEKQYLLDLMSLSEGNVKEACRISGLSQSRLYALLKQHKISRPR